MPSTALAEPVSKHVMQWLNYERRRVDEFAPDVARQDAARLFFWQGAAALDLLHRMAVCVPIIIILHTKDIEMGSIARYAERRVADSSH